MVLWKVIIRYHTDDIVAEELKGWYPRGAAEKLDERTNQFLDHDVFYTEIVELPS